MSDLVTAARKLVTLIEGQAAVGLILDSTVRAARDVRMILNGTASVRAEAVIVEPDAICTICGEEFEDEDLVYEDLVYLATDESGYTHSHCCKPDRSAFTGSDGKPLAPGEPIPRPWVWEASERCPTHIANDGANDDVRVHRFAKAMKAKLAAAREKGRGGWDDPAQCSIAQLSAQLIEHISKGDPIDVANFAMMIHQRGERIVAPVTLVVPELSSEQLETLGKLRGVGAIHLAADETFKAHQPGYTTTHLRNEVAKAKAYGLELAAHLIEATIIEDTASGKILTAREDGNPDGLHYATAIRQVATDGIHPTQTHVVDTISLRDLMQRMSLALDDLSPNQAISAFNGVSWVEIATVAEIRRAAKAAHSTVNAVLVPEVQP